MPARQAIPTAFGVITVISVGVLVVCDVVPQLFPSDTHDIVAALPLVLIAATYLIYRAVRRGPPVEWAKTLLLVLAFLFWAANMLCEDRKLARLFNDIAISAFVFDGLLILFGKRPASACAFNP
jgi:ABC-type transport system involved in cytochrome c biogenesis permease subunit